MQKLALSLFSGTLMGLTSIGLAQASRFYFEYGTDKAFIQSSAAGPRFDGGRFRVLLADGVYVYNDECQLNGSFYSFDPAGSLGCPTGATGLIASGDLDEDGFQDAQTYWEILAPISRSQIEPFRSDLCKLAAAPASTLKRPLWGFSDISLDIFWNLREWTFVRQYTISKYRMGLDYDYDFGGDGVPSDVLGAKMLKDIVPGRYIFQFPTLNAPTVPATLSVGLLPFLEGYSSSTTAGRQGFTFVGNRWYGGYYQIDPRLVNTFNWTRNQAVIAGGSDKLFFSIDSDFSLNRFPPDGGRLLLPNVLATSYVMPGGFFEIGETGELSLDYDRNYVPVNTSGISGVYDGSTREFKMPLKFVDTYDGYARVSRAFPAGVTLTQIAANTDYDKDGFTNATEFAMRSCPADPAITSISSTPTEFTITMAGGHRWSAGDSIVVTGAKKPAYNGIWTVASATSTTITITSNINPDPVTPSGAGGVVALVDGLEKDIVGISPGIVVDDPDTDLDDDAIPSYFNVFVLNHGLRPGDTILIQGVSPSFYNGVWTVAEVPGDSTIRVNAATDAGAGTGGTVELFGQLAVFGAEVETLTYSRVHNVDNTVTITIQKRPDVGASLKYGLETKAPAATTWAKATVGAAATFKWTLMFEDEAQIIFKSKSAVGVPLNTHIRPVATAVF